MPLAGPDGSALWFEFLKSVLVGVESGCFVFRDYVSETGDPRSAGSFLNNPLIGARLVHAVRCVLVQVCGMSWDDAGRWQG